MYEAYFCGAKDTLMRKSVKGYRSSLFTKQKYCCSVFVLNNWKEMFLSISSLSLSLIVFLCKREHCSKLFVFTSFTPCSLELTCNVNPKTNLKHNHPVKLLWVTAREESLHPDTGINVSRYWLVGEVFDYLVAHGRMKEKEARAKFRQVCITSLYISFLPPTPIFSGEMGKTAVLCVWLSMVCGLVALSKKKLGSSSALKGLVVQSAVLASLVFVPGCPGAPEHNDCLIWTWILFQNSFPLGWFHIFYVQLVCNLLEVVQV